MSEPVRLLPVVTVPPFERVITELLRAADTRHDDGPAGGFMIRFRAAGLSMYPAIRDGELITVAPVAARHIARGDILLCRTSTQLLAHRVVAVAAGEHHRVLQLRGDAKAACDAAIAFSDVIGRVMSVRRGGREIRLCGRQARLRHRARTVASHLKTMTLWSMAVAERIAQLETGAREK